jgi:uncharacterized protein (TIGR00369 family)
MSDENLLESLKRLNASAGFNVWAGFEPWSAEAGRVELRMPWREDLGQYAGFLHAGVVSALLDTACGFAAYTQAGLVLASHLSVSFLAPARGSRFAAHGEVLKAGKRQIYTRAELLAETDGAWRRVATGETLLIPA